MHSSRHSYFFQQLIHYFGNIIWTIIHTLTSVKQKLPHLVASLLDVLLFLMNQHFMKPQVSFVVIIFATISNTYFTFFPSFSSLNSSCRLWWSLISARTPWLDPPCCCCWATSVHRTPGTFLSPPLILLSVLIAVFMMLSVTDSLIEQMAPEGDYDAHTILELLCTGLRFFTSTRTFLSPSRLSWNPPSPLWCVALLFLVSFMHYLFNCSLTFRLFCV